MRPNDLHPPQEVAFYGIDPETGGLLCASRHWAEIHQDVIEAFDLRPLPEGSEDRSSRAGRDSIRFRGQPPYGINPEHLDETGWGLIYAEGLDEEDKRALRPLLDHRSAQAGALFQEFDNERALPTKMSASEWLVQRGVGLGVGDVERVPYYLMVVGGPERRPFGVEFDLSMSGYAVGRLAFDEPADYRRYALNVIAAEESGQRRNQRVTLVGMKHRDDVTQLSCSHLVRPLIEKFSSHEHWDLESVLGEAATKQRLGELLGRSETPAILFTAGHGLGPGPTGDSSRVGALLCAPYPGPEAWKAQGGGVLREDWIFAATDIAPEADLRGLVAVLFGCFTAGMPSHDSFSFKVSQPLGNARMAALAGRLLSHERGALAVLGHVDRAWSYSYYWRRVPQPHSFLSVLGALLDNQPIGVAATFLSNRYGALSVELGEQMQKALRGEPVDTVRFTQNWMAERDARGYLIYGDPAVRVGYHSPSPVAARFVGSSS